MTSNLLGELVTIRGGGTPRRDVPAYWNGSIPWATVKDFSSTVISDTLEYISSEGVAKSATNIIPPGNIILPTRMALGKVAINLVDIAINQDLKALIIKDSQKVDRDYLFRFLQSKASFIESCGKGATVKGIRLEILRDIEIPLPPLEEQKRIATILDKTDAIRQKRLKAIKLTNDFLRATFLTMFGDPELNPKKWDKGTIRDLVDEVKYGTSKKAHESTGNYPILRMNNITYDGEIDLSDLKYIDLDKNEEDKYLAKKGDLLFNRTNSKELVGKTAVYDKKEPMAIAGYLIRVRANSESNPYYISGYLNSKHGKATLLNMCKSIIGMANINAQELQDIKILIPPAELQHKYGKIVEKIKDNRINLLKALDHSELLFKSISQKAFQGKL